MQASLKLVSLISGRPVHHLEAMYNHACENSDPVLFGHEGPPEEDLEEAKDADEKNQCLDLLDALKSENDMFKQVAELEETPAGVPAEEKDQKDPEFADVPGGEELAALCQSNAEHTDDSLKGKLPRTLLEAVGTKACLFNSLWRYLLHLRSTAAGCDRQFIPNPRNLRQASSKLNWHQPLACI